jgi:asparagine synthase (glutamine-hydrolysing)
MCGIVGFQDYTENKEHVIKEMMQRIKHRGPDDEGSLLIDNVSFGHVRLSIIDIIHGKQPMQTEDERYSLIFNGEIYNYIELRQYLTSKGYKFRTHSDTEVLLKLYAEYGKKAVNYLNGMFAFAIYDKKEKTLFLARDHFGIKPLYYYEGKNSFVFGSEVKAILKHPNISANVDEKSLYEYLTFQLILKKHTLFKNIFELEPASYIIVKKSKIVEKKQYWTLNYTIDETSNKDQLTDELLVLLQNSLSIQIRSDVPVGTHLSGGIDSSSVAVLASKNYFGQLQTFTGGFKENKDYDETGYARIISKYINSDYKEIFPTYNDFIDVLPNLIYHMDYPGGGPGIFPQYMVSKLASQYVKVVLGGQGGDEIFGGYARYAVAYLEQCLKGAIFETQEEGKHVVTLGSIINNLPLLKQYTPMIEAQFSSGLFDGMDKRYYNLIDRSPNIDKIYTKDFLSKRDANVLFDKFQQIFNNPDTPSYFNKMTYFDIKTLLPTLLQVEDRVSMAVSLESRVPLLDRRIAEFAAKLPPTMKFAGGQTKHMLVQAVKNVLPKKIIERKDKMGFPVPINEWLKGPLEGYVLDIFNSQKAKNRGIYNTGAITNHIRNAGKFNRDLWGALNLELWFNQFID